MEVDVEMCWRWRGRESEVDVLIERKCRYKVPDVEVDVS